MATNQHIWIRKKALKFLSDVIP